MNWRAGLQAFWDRAGGGLRGWMTYMLGMATGGVLTLAAVLAPEYPLVGGPEDLASEYLEAVLRDTGETEAASPQLLRAVRVFAETLALVDARHVGTGLDRESVAGMVDGALRSLDPFSGFLGRRDTRRIVGGEKTGEGSHIGVLISGHDGKYLIESVVPGSPAARAGVRPGDRIVELGGQYVGDKSPYQINEMLFDRLGAKGSQALALGVAREDTEKVVRRRLDPRPMETRSVFSLGVRDKVLHLLLRRFYPGLAEDTAELINTAMSERQIEGVVLDLRGNGGGRTSEARDVAGLFLEQGRLLYRMSGRGVGSREVRTREVPRFPELGVSVLVNGATASASEIVAAAMQVHGRGEVVGWPTFGKGSVQRVYPVGDGAIKLTVAHYRDAGLRRVEGVGVTPDRVMAAPDPEYRASRFAADGARRAAIAAARRGGR